MKVYYAHCVAIYDTPQEVRDLATLARFNLEPVNPNTPEVQAACNEAKARGENVMDLFKRYVDECDAVAFRALPDGSIPSGIAQELSWFLAAGKPVIELPNAITRRGLNYELTKEYLRDVGDR